MRLDRLTRFAPLAFITLLVCVFALLFVTRGETQTTHYCDTTVATSGTAETNAPLLMQVCSPAVDANGNPLTTTTQVTGWALYTTVGNGTPVRTTPALVKGTTSAVSGKTVWSMSTTAPATSGAVSYQWAPINAKGEAAKSTPPFVLTVTLPLTVPGVATNGTLQ